MPGQIIGVNKSSLWLAWKEIRVGLRNATVRDVIDYLDYDIEPNVWIGRLLREISLGVFEPNRPFRFPLAKSPSFKRILTFPLIPDLVLYRAIADYIHLRAKRYQQPHVYYRRAEFHKATTAAQQEADQDMRQLAANYRFTSRVSFLNWLNYAQYRKYLVVKKVFRFIVISDITNFFNSILHSEVSNAFETVEKVGWRAKLHRLFYVLAASLLSSTQSPQLFPLAHRFRQSRWLAAAQP